MPDASDAAQNTTRDDAVNTLSPDDVIDGIAHHSSPKQASFMPRASRTEDTPPTLDQNLEIIRDHIRQAVKSFHDLKDNEEALLLEMDPDLPDVVGDLAESIVQSAPHDYQHTQSNTSEYTSSGSEHAPQPRILPSRQNPRDLVVEKFLGILNR
jgi:hypothetical protein